jgi:hypothetical protein
MSAQWLARAGSWVAKAVSLLGITDSALEVLER